MGLAANAVADLVGAPPPSRAAASANGEDSATSSFQDHVDANDRQQSPSEHPDRTPARNAEAQTSPQQTDDQTLTKVTPREAQAHDAEAGADLVQPPFFLQLITNFIAPTVGRVDQPQPAQQQNAQEASGAQVQAPATAAQNGATPPLLVTPKSAPKSDEGARPATVKSAKAATAKIETAEGVAVAVLASPVGPSAQQQIAQQIATPQLVTPQESPENEADAKLATIEKAQAPGSQLRQPSQPVLPQLAPQPPAPINGDAKPRQAAKALPQADAVKQAAQELTPASPKTPAPKPAPAAPAATHAQLASPPEQTFATNTDARTQAAPVAAQVGGEIIRRFNGQDASFHLRLDPPDLGRVDVRLDVSRDHRVTAVISADNPQALSDLARGARDLQQALQSAGLDLADDGLRFDLSSNGQGNAFAQAQAQQEQSGLRTAPTAQTETSTAQDLTASRPLRIDSWRGARVDLVA